MFEWSNNTMVDQCPEYNVKHQESVIIRGNDRGGRRLCVTDLIF